MAQRTTSLIVVGMSPAVCPVATMLATFATLHVHRVEPQQRLRFSVEAPISKRLNLRVQVLGESDRRSTIPRSP